MWYVLCRTGVRSRYSDLTICHSSLQCDCSFVLRKSKAVLLHFRRHIKGQLIFISYLKIQMARY
jgi:hypothetical protein